MKKLMVTETRTPPPQVFSNNVWHSLYVLQIVDALLLRCPANMAHIRQSRPDSGLCFQVKVLQMWVTVTRARLR